MPTWLRLGWLRGVRCMCSAEFMKYEEVTTNSQKGSVATVSVGLIVSGTLQSASARQQLVRARLMSGDGEACACSQSVLCRLHNEALQPCHACQHTREEGRGRLLPLAH